MANIFDKLKFKRPKFASYKTKQVPHDLWLKCIKCSAPIFKKNFIQNLLVCQNCDFHHKLNARERLELLIDKGSFIEMDKDMLPLDPLNFGDDYYIKVKKDQEKCGLNEAVLSGTAAIGGNEVVLGIMDFHFRGGSMGSVVGEKIVRVLEEGASSKRPVVIVSASGGARMQEGMLSLMQLTRTSAAVNKLAKERVLYICVMTDPTTAGVAASFASLADIIIAEPGAIIGFSGARVIEQTIRQKLPPGFQTSEFYLKHGFIDKVVHRKQLRQTLIMLLSFIRVL